MSGMTQENALPKSVQAQIDRANEIIKQVYPEQVKDGEAVNPEDPKAKEEPKAKEQPKDPEPVKSEVEDPAPAPAKEDPAPDDALAAAEQRYKVLQGKYNAEVPRLQQQLRDALDANRDMREQHSNLKAKVALMEEKAKSTPAAPAKLPLSQEEIDQFGPDLIDIIERVAGATVTPLIDQKVGTVAKDVQQVKQNTGNIEKTMAESSREKMMKALAEAVPNWEAQDQDPNFLEWLDQTDPYSNTVRGKMLGEAFQANNASRVIAFFKGFQNENRVVSSDQPAAAPAEKGSQTGLDKLVAPGSPKTGTNTAPNESGKRKWTQKDISALYSKKNEYVRKGLPVPKELAAAESDLIRAQGEGRVFV